jgi:hypothetical protein
MLCSTAHFVNKRFLAHLRKPLFRPDVIALIYKTINSDQFYEVGHLIMTTQEVPTAEEAR